MSRKKILLSCLFAIPACCLLAFLVYQIPPVHQRLAWRIDEQLLRLRYRLNPPEEVVFVPQKQQAALPAPKVHVTAAPTLTASPTVASAAQQTPSTPTPTQPTATPTVTTTPLPSAVALKGVIYQDQAGRFNYCAPANLAMALSFWKWQGDQDIVGKVLKPDPKDKNVMPYEMVAYVNSETKLRAVERSAGDVDLLRRMVAAGFPVLVEKGTYLHDLSGNLSWMGHYQVVTGYNDGKLQFITQDSYTNADFKVSYSDMISAWRAFNYVYIIIYPAERENKVAALLGADWDEKTNYQHAAELASEEIYRLDGIDLFFAWYNRGTSLNGLQDYAGASEAYDQAFAVYPNIPQDKRPWRMLWYQTGPYAAYYYNQRYTDVLNLTDATLRAMASEQNLEESYYWRGMARAATGDTAAAIEDFRLSLQYHPGFEVSLFELRKLGVENP